MNYALIFAGGCGRRMNSKSRPKQFLELHGKEIIIYTIEHFEKHPDIEGIVVVCIKEWIDYLKRILDKNGIKKVKWIVPGGETGQDSIYNGLKVLHDNCKNEDIVLIHDGVRPLIDEQLITENIESVKNHGSAITVAPVIETVMLADDDKVYKSVERSKCNMAKAPQSFFLKDIYAAHEKAREEGIHDKIDSATMMSDYGHSLYTVKCGYENIKITTPSDYFTFRALIDAKENSQIFGI